MTSRRTFMASTAAAAALGLAAPRMAIASGRTPVVATFSILADMVKRIGGDHVAVTSLVGPNGDAHMLRPSPDDARAVNQAKLLVVNGLGFEGWLDRLVEASDFKGAKIIATDGANLIAYEEGAHGDGDHADEDEHGHDDHADKDEHGHEHGKFDPHAWQSLGNGAVYAKNIAAALAQVAPANADDFKANLAGYVAEIEALDAEIREMVDALPADRRTVVTSHDAFQYFGRDYGLTFLAPQGLSTESEASAKEVAQLIWQIRAQKIKAVFVENVADSRLLERIASETGAKIGGKLYPGALSESDGPAPTYLAMMRHNARTLSQALSA